MNASQTSIIFFDGVCALCDGFVTWTYQRDKKKVFKFAPLQGQTAKDLLGLEPDEMLDSVILRHEGELYYRSAAALKVLGLLGGFYKIALIFFIIPTPIRDWVYNFIAKRRYGWFGKFDQCRLPRPGEQDRFLP